MDLGFVVDSSGSLGVWLPGCDWASVYAECGKENSECHKEKCWAPGSYNMEKDFIKTIATKLGLSASGVHASVVQFSDTARLEMAFMDDILRPT